MIDSKLLRWQQLVAREVNEHRRSFLLLPLGLALLLILASLSISISVANVESLGEMRVEVFSSSSSPSLPDADTPEKETMLGGNLLNPALETLNGLFTLTMLLVAMSYLSSCLYLDRNNGSVLFWKTLPITDWEEMATKLLTALLVLPLIFLGLSLFTQTVAVLIANTVVESSTDYSVVDYLSPGELLVSYLADGLQRSVWAMPLASWLLLCSAYCQRSPLGFAIGIPIVLVVCERFFIGTNVVDTVLDTYSPWANAETVETRSFLALIAGYGAATAALYFVSRMRRWRLDVN